MKSSLVLTAVLALTLGSGARGQFQAFVPDNSPMSTGNSIPFGSATYTCLEVIPAAYMNQFYRRVVEVAFQPVASATFACNTLFMGLGHVASAAACPFSYPQPGTTNIGTFLDFTPIYDTSTQGPLSWPLTANAWSPLGFAATGGTNFVWDGVHDVGFFSTHTGATGLVSCQSSFTLVPARNYHFTYAAAASTSCYQPSGLYIRLSFGAAENAFTAVTTGGGVGDLNMSLTGITAGATEGYVLVTGYTGLPIDTGSFLGIEPDGFTFLFAQTPLAVGNPLHFPIGVAGVWPAQPFVLGPGALLLSGQTWDAVAVVFGPGFSYLGHSPVQRLAW